MAKNKRKKRKEKKIDYFEPIDINLIGTKDDPCFGKLYSLSDETCRMCGDNARCAIVTGQTQLLDKGKLEKEHRFKDMEAAEKDEILDFIIKKIKKGKKRFQIIKSCNTKFGKNRKLYKQLYYAAEQDKSILL